MTITAQARPYLLTFKATGTSYPVSSEEAQRTIDELGGIVKATKNRVVFYGHNTSKASEYVILHPATVGGGPAFVITQ